MINYDAPLKLPISNNGNLTKAWDEYLGQISDSMIGEWGTITKWTPSANGITTSDPISGTIVHHGDVCHIHIETGNMTCTSNAEIALPETTNKYSLKAKPTRLEFTELTTSTSISAQDPILINNNRVYLNEYTGNKAVIITGNFIKQRS